MKTPPELEMSDRKGRVVYRSAPGPWGFKVDELEAALATLC